MTFRWNNKRSALRLAAPAQISSPQQSLKLSLSLLPMVSFAYETRPRGASGASMATCMSNLIHFPMVIAKIEGCWIVKS